MAFKLPYMQAMRECVPKMFQELSKSGELDEFVQLKAMEAHRLFLELTKDAPKGSGGGPAQPWRREAEEQVMALMLEFDQSDTSPSQDERKALLNEVRTDTLSILAALTFELTRKRPGRHRLYLKAVSAASRAADCSRPPRRAPPNADSPLCHSKWRASCSSDNREPASLSSTRKPDGRFLHKKVTSVPPDTSSNVTTIVISPKKAGSVVTKLTASTILHGGASSTNRTLNMSSLSDILPRKERSFRG
jgi:hypothetical protein